MWSVVLGISMELFACLVAFVCIGRLRHTIFIYFVPFLLLTVLVEWGVYLTTRAFGSFNNHWIYNIFILIEFLFYYVLYGQLLMGEKIKRFIQWWIPVFILLAVLNWVFFQGFLRYDTYTVMLGSFVLLVLVFFFFNELMLSAERISLLRYPPFWISIGLLTFYSGQFITLAFFEYMIRTNNFSFATVLNFSMRYLNVILYTCYIVAFLCKRPAKT